MVKDFLISFSDNFKEKTKNPFLGTYLVVWLFRNWELIYTIFNFDANFKLSDKKKFIIDYYKDHDFINNLINNIFWSFGILILTYLLLNLSRLIVNFSEKRLTPWIYKITDSNSIVLKEEYDRIRSENNDLQYRLEKERESKLRLETNIKSLENEIIEIAKSNSEYKLDSNTKKDSTSILIQKLKDREMLEKFVLFSTAVNNGEAVRNDNQLKNHFTELGLIKFENSFGNDTKKYSITEDGEKVLRKIRFET